MSRSSHRRKHVHRSAGTPGSGHSAALRGGSLVVAATLLGLCPPAETPPAPTAKTDVVRDVRGKTSAPSPVPGRAFDDREEVVVEVPPWQGVTGVVDQAAVERTDPASNPAPEVTEGVVVAGIPAVAHAAYTAAANALASERPACRIDWPLVAAIGRVESNHGRYGGARLRIDGTSTPPIRGIPLDGRPGVAHITDSDGGLLDGDPVLDRAVGPMQFLPSTWRAVFPTGDPDNMFDAAHGAARYLCSGGGDLSRSGDQASAVFRYNHSRQYVDLVLGLARQYRDHGVAVLRENDATAVAGPFTGPSSAPPPALAMSLQRTRFAPEPNNTTPAPPPAPVMPTTTPQAADTVGTPAPPQTTGPQTATPETSGQETTSPETTGEPPAEPTGGPTEEPVPAPTVDATAEPAPPAPSTTTEPESTPTATAEPGPAETPEATTPPATSEEPVLSIEVNL